MKNLLTIIICFASVFNLIAQAHSSHEKRPNTMRPNSEITIQGMNQLSNKMDLKQEIKAIKESFMAEESILDSIVYYSYYSQTDSVNNAKTTYAYFESGLPMIRYEYLWDETNESWLNDVKTSYLFDDDENLQSYYQFNWDANQGQWVNFKKLDMTHDENGYESSLTYLKWNIDLDRWDNFYKDESDHNDQGGLLLLQSWMGDDANEWIPDFKEENTYYPDNLKHTKIMASWDLGTNDWDYWGKDIFFYNQTSLLDSTESYVWMMDAWKLNQKNEYFYTPTDQLDYYMGYMRNIDVWTQTWKEEYDYDANDNLISSISFVWDVTDWMNSSKNERAYDGNNNMLFYANWYWDPVGDDWIATYKREYNYNENSIKTMDSWYDWNADLNSWVGWYKYNFNVGEEGETMIRFEYAWDALATDWILDLKGFYYRSLIIGIPDSKSKDFVIYPNPVTDQLYLETTSLLGAQCYLVSLTGQVMNQYEIERAVSQITINEIPSGLYFLKVVKGNKVVTKKFIKR